MAKKKRAPRTFRTDEEKRSIIAEIGPLSINSVAANHGINATMLGRWRKKLGGKPFKLPASAAPSPPSSNGNGSPTLVLDGDKGPRVAVHGLSSYLRTIVREELRSIVIEELAKLVQAGVGS